MSKLSLLQNPDAPSVTVYAFHPRSEGHGCDLLSSEQNLGTLGVGDRELAKEVSAQGPVEACDYYVAKKGRLTFEYILIAGVKDTDE